MINPAELRIGNLLQGPPLSIPREGIYSDGVVAMTAYGIHMLGLLDGEDPYKPIPITTEWLGRLGFTFAVPPGYLDHFWHIRIDLDTVLAYDESREFWMDKYNREVFGNTSDTISIPSQIKYVHQLQNLVYALTGEELELKEK